MTSMALGFVVFLTVATQCMLGDALERQKRGFRNSALSTARGFGKRVPAEAGELPDFAPFDSNRPIPAAWLAEQVTRSPALAKLLVDRAVDLNGDGVISQDELYQAL